MKRNGQNGRISLYIVFCFGHSEAKHFFNFKTFQIVCWNICKESVLVANIGNMRWFSWLTRYATSRKVTGSNPDKGTEFLNLPNPSSLTIAQKWIPEDLCGARAQPALKAWADCLDNVGSSASQIPIGLRGLLEG
jgi:hypothetical protein